MASASLPKTGHTMLLQRTRMTGSESWFVFVVCLSPFCIFCVICWNWFAEGVFISEIHNCIKQIRHSGHSLQKQSLPYKVRRMRMCACLCFSFKLVDVLFRFCPRLKILGLVLFTRGWETSFECKLYEKRLTMLSNQSVFVSVTGSTF